MHDDKQRQHNVSIRMGFIGDDAIIRLISLTMAVIMIC
jgi:hypothetical protein